MPKHKSKLKQKEIVYDMLLHKSKIAEETKLRWIQERKEFITLSLSFSFSLSIDRFSPSSRRSISRTVSPERVLNFFLIAE